MSGNGRRLLLCAALSLLLCLSHIRGSTVLILACLAVFMVIVAQACMADISFPVLMYFLPWSPILRIDPHSFSLYTVALVLVCAISVLKRSFRFKRYHVAVTLILTVLTLFAKLISGTGISFDYIAFLMLLLVFPVVKEEWLAGKYDFYQVVVCFSVGIIISALCAMTLASYSNLAKFIRIDAYLTVIRRSGFYGDANFYTAQITAAIGGGLLGLLRERKQTRTVLLFILQVFLLYCGFLSGSKSFVLITLTLVILWLVGLFGMQGRGIFKILLILAAVLVAAFIATSEMFRGLIEVLGTRFSFHSTLSDFTTGRTDLWVSYAAELIGNWKTLFFGEGFTNVIIGEKSTHNTLLQMIFQLGLLGTPVLIVWMGCFFLDAPKNSKRTRRSPLCMSLLLIGAFSPWLAVDALFFDEFFLLQMYVYLGVRWLAAGETVQQLETDTPNVPNLEAGG